VRHDLFFARVYSFSPFLDGSCFHAYETVAFKCLRKIFGDDECGCRVSTILFPLPVAIRSTFPLSPAWSSSWPKAKCHSKLHVEARFSPSMRQAFWCFQAFLLACACSVWEEALRRSKHCNPLEFFFSPPTIPLCPGRHFYRFAKLMQQLRTNCSSWFPRLSLDPFCFPSRLSPPKELPSYLRSVNKLLLNFFATSSDILQCFLLYTPLGCA